MIVKNKSQKLRFIAVGAANTFIDFSILFFLKSLGVPPLIANIASTSVAFCFSFLANKEYTFKSTHANLKREISLFIIVTLFGLWILQTIVIKIVSELLVGTPLSDQTVLFIAKILATIASLIWNYIFYSNVVFKSMRGE